MSKLNHFQHYKLPYEIGALCLLFLISSGISATSTIMEASRHSQALSFQLWEPFVWEVSSAVSAILLFPLITMMLKRFPMRWGNVGRTCVIVVIGSVIYSLLHVGFMVLFREGVYWFMGSNYDFGDVWFELLYEYRKDLWSFIGFIVFVQAYEFIFSRLQGEANPVAESEDDNISQQFDRLLIKKLGKEFIINVKDIEWLEASGNYVNLHSKGRIYPMRATLTKLIDQISHHGFCRIHRSFAVNLAYIESITPTGNGDSEIALLDGKRLNLSRRYKEAFKLTL